MQKLHKNGGKNGRRKKTAKNWHLCAGVAMSFMEMDCNKHATNVDNLTAWKCSKLFPNAYRTNICRRRRCTLPIAEQIEQSSRNRCQRLSLFKELHVQVICNYRQRAFVFAAIAIATAMQTEATPEN